MEDINVIIRSICQDLYENLRYNNSIFANYKSLKYLKKLRKINITTDYKYAENIRDEIGILYKNYIVFCRKKEYENHSKIIEEIKKMYFEISYSIEQLLVNDGIKYTYKEYKNLDDYINRLKSSYGGQTEKYIKKLSKKNIGTQKKEIKRIYNDKSKIISEKKRNVIKILEEKLNAWNSKYVGKNNIKIEYNSKNAEYIVTQKVNDEIVKKKKYKFKSKFSDIEQLQKKAIKNLRQMNFGISIFEELNISEDCFKYIDPFALTIFIEEGNLDYAKLYLRQLNGESQSKKYKLPFKIIYNIDEDFQNGRLTPIRNEIIAIIAERNALFVAEIKKVKSLKKAKIG